jgi:hypothetical protein
MDGQMIIIIILSLALVGVSGGFIAYAVQKNEKCQAIDCTSLNEDTCKTHKLCTWDDSKNECNTKHADVQPFFDKACGYISNKDNCNKVPGCKFGL